MRLTRRDFVRSAGVGVGALLLPPFASRTAHAATLPLDRTLVVLFLRGGADGINLVVPRGDEANYLALRRNEETGQDITIPPAPPELQLDGFFELHPALGPLMPLYDAGELAVVHAVGGTGSYSHFSAQDAMERAEPIDPTLIAEGWLYRALQSLQARGGLDAPVLALSGVSLAPRDAKAMGGSDPTTRLAFPSIAQFRLTGEFPDEVGGALEDIYRASPYPLAANSGGPLFDAMAVLEGIGAEPPAAVYPSGSGQLNANLQDAARLIKHPELGVKAITIDFGGWDHHSSEIAGMDRSAGRLATALAAFHEDLGADRDRATVLVMTEFGRTAAVNGNDGTDHGWATVMLALGGGVAGGRVLTRGDPANPGGGLPTPDGHWPGLGPGELHVQPGTSLERDLAATTDYRDVFGELAERFLGLPADAVRDEVLRGYAPVLPGLFL